MQIDINCDMGEGMPNDEALMPYIHSANIACGKHAGSLELMENTMRLCSAHNVNIGAHPGFDDRENFGRKEIHLEENLLYELFYQQVKDAMSIADKLGLQLHHVKPHGAMYNMAAEDRRMARTLAEATLQADPTLIFYGLSGSCMIAAAEAVGLKTANEVFADRNYSLTGKLLPRSHPHALINQPETALIHARNMVFRKEIHTPEGKIISAEADTLCIHGDHPAALYIARTLHSSLINPS
ncbi:MAG: 5-oxoprolinase subunit PxpA [Chitinophagaceae bacterium]